MEQSNRFEQWQQAQWAFNAVLDFVKHGNSSTEDKANWVAAFPQTFDFAKSLSRQLCEALELVVLLDKFPQFSEKASRFVFDGVTFFVECGEKQQSTVFFMEDENAFHLQRTDIYTDTRDGKQYTVKGIAMTSGVRIYAWWHLDGVVIGKHDWLKNQRTNALFNRMTGADSALVDALDKAQTAMLVKTGLIV